MKVFMRRIALALIVVGAVAIAAILPSIIESEPSWEERVRELERTDPFISVHDEGGYYSQSIDKDAAEQAGISKRTVLLAYEILDFQNRLAFEAYRSEILGVPMAEVELREFPKVEEFFDEATQKAEEEKETEERRIEGLSLQIDPFRIGGVDVAQAHLNHADDASPCGNFGHPIPNETPSRFEIQHGNPASGLRAAGFASTSPPAACMFWYGCVGDYTRPRSHTTSDHEGTCEEPFFRDHGKLTPSGYSIQKGEPNPESVFMNPRRWPTCRWLAYVWWWHDTF